MSRPHFNNQRGDLLVEVVLALSILAAVLLGAMNVASRAFSTGSSARDRTQAANLLQEQAEALRNYRDSHVWVGDAGTALNPGGSFYMDSSGGWHPMPGSVTKLNLFTLEIQTTSATADKLTFNIIANWTADGGGKSIVSTTLVNLDRLAQ